MLNQKILFESKDNKNSIEIKLYKIYTYDVYKKTFNKEYLEKLFNKHYILNDISNCFSS